MHYLELLAFKKKKKLFTECLVETRSVRQDHFMSMVIAFIFYLI